jgi:hypothetical protein
VRAVVWQSRFALQSSLRKSTELLVREGQRSGCKDASLLWFLAIRLATGEQFVAPGNHRRGSSNQLSSVVLYSQRTRRYCCFQEH